MFNLIQEKKKMLSVSILLNVPVSKLTEIPASKSMEPVQIYTRNGKANLHVQLNGWSANPNAESDWVTLHTYNAQALYVLRHVSLTDNFSVYVQGNLEVSGWIGDDGVVRVNKDIKGNVAQSVRLEFPAGSPNRTNKEVRELLENFFEVDPEGIEHLFGDEETEDEEKPRVRRRRQQQPAEPEADQHPQEETEDLELKSSAGGGRRTPRRRR